MTRKRNDLLLKIGLVASIAVLAAAIISFVILIINVVSSDSHETDIPETTGQIDVTDSKSTQPSDTAFQDSLTANTDSDNTSDILDTSDTSASDTADTDISIGTELKPGVEYIMFPAFLGKTAAELPDIISELYTLGIRSNYSYEYNEENEKYTIFDVGFSGCEIGGNYYIEKTSDVNITLSLGSESAGTQRDRELMTIYFTIDDGPSAETDETLAILDKYNVKATFFTIGHIAKARPGNLKKIYEAGHLIACHSYSHIINDKADGYIYSSPEALCEDILKWEQAVTSILGFFPENSKIFRFPGGSSQVPEENRAAFKAKLSELGYRGYDWTFANCDAWPGGNVNGLPTDEYLRESFVSTLNGAKNRVKICLMHDRIEESRNQLEEEIRYLIANGYVFDTLDHLSYDCYSTK